MSKSLPPPLPSTSRSPVTGLGTRGWLQFSLRPSPLSFFFFLSFHPSIPWSVSVPRLASSFFLFIRSSTSSSKPNFSTTEKADSSLDHRLLLLHPRLQLFFVMDINMMYRGGQEWSDC
ncbi:hypothetical protein ACFX14_046145 [Malus domestica]